MLLPDGYAKQTFWRTFVQRTTSGAILFSPSDLIVFLGCRHASLLTRANLDEKKVQTEEDAGLLLLQKKGYEHERAYVERLKDQGLNVVAIPKDMSLAQRTERSIEAMRSGVDVLYQATFCHQSWRGDADFLIRCGRPSALGNFSYEVADTKLARTPEPKHIIQLCAYSEFLESVQGIRPQYMHLVLGDCNQYPFSVDDFFYYYANVKQRFTDFQEELNRSGIPANLPLPDPCKQCDFCQWTAMCQEAWDKADHLSQVANIQKSQIDKLRKAGVATLAGLAALPPATRIRDMQQETLERLRSQAALQFAKRKTGEDRVELLPLAESKGFARLPRPDDGDLFFDMEGDPYYPDGLEYLFGVYYAADGSWCFLPFWGHDHEEEKRAFRDFMAFVAKHLAAHPNAHIYHYNHYETTALKRLSCRYAVCEEQMDNLLRRGTFVDLYFVVREAIRTSEPGYSIKNLETFYMEKRTGEVATAGDSVVVYNRWRELGDQTLLDNIAQYNEVDCISTRKLRDWLLELRPEGVVWRDGTPVGETEDSSVPERKEWEIEYEAYSARLENAATEEDPALSTTSHLLEFHRREAKPQWWSGFERQDKLEEELIDDLECIGGLRLAGASRQEKRSLVYAYSFPPQEYKIRVNSTVDDVFQMQRAGTVLDIDEQACRISIKRGMSQGPLPEKLNIGPQGPLKTDTIRAALYRFADRMLVDETDEVVGGQILRRNLPRIRGRELGTPVLSGTDTLAGAIEAVANLDASYLFIQGPPGTGKTYTSGHIIAELIRRGYTVGVSSNSHKAIHNLLAQVEKVALERGIVFTGVKKSSVSNPESYFAGSCILNEDDTGAIPHNCALYAGTAWLFADERLDGLLDYLFIDEAGQVALANVIAMSGSTRNIVLVGDQMQLGQPTQGTHPGEAGASVLEYLLRDHATIPPERGIFLAETRRMAPGVCSFISLAFYDGRLAPHPDTTLRALLAPDEGTDPENFTLPHEGIVLLEVNHHSRTQKSSEEGEIVLEAYNRLLTMTFRDSTGKERPLTRDDILVVSPYNMQVNLLESMLPKGARVGTVDKFQGQEAPVVFFSMATSSGEDLPRNIEFLFSKNRLNVAISRAQCLAVVVASPLLAEAACKTVDQMRLVNTFCWLCDYAQRVQ